MKRKWDMKRKAGARNTGSKLARVVKLAAAIAALGSTVGVDAGRISFAGWLNPAEIAASQKKVEGVHHKLAPAGMVKVENVMLRNGQRVQIRGDRMFIIGADGRQSLAKDGTYPLVNGKIIKVLNGRAIIDDN